MKQRVIITGVTGFIGKNLCQFMGSKDYEIAAIVRDVSKVDPSLPISRCFELNSSFEDLDRFITDFDPCAVFHLASLFISNHKSNDILPLIKSNIEFGTTLLEAVSHCKSFKYFINIGSSWQTAVHNTADYNPMDLYAATKQAFEDILHFYCDLYGMKSITLRLFDTYGENDPRRKLLQLLKDSLKNGESLNMSPGEQQIDLLHVSDVCRAIERAFYYIQKEECRSGSVYAVRGGNPLKLKELVALIETCSGKRLHISWGSFPYRPNEIMKVNTALPLLPGWQPEITLKDGLKKFFNIL